MLAFVRERVLASPRHRPRAHAPRAVTTAQREELSPDESKHWLRVAPRRVSVLGIVTAAAGALVLVLAITSLSWPRYHDGALMEYLAWSIRHGNRPYVDLF